MNVRARVGYVGRQELDGLVDGQHRVNTLVDLVMTYKNFISTGIIWCILKIHAH